MIYETLRHLADSWGLVAMLAFYLCCVGWVFLPRNRHRNQDAATMIFRDADHG
jgi:cytochrome c oxidase cbb3-type subunit IV